MAKARDDLNPGPLRQLTSLTPAKLVLPAVVLALIVAPFLIWRFFRPPLEIPLREDQIVITPVPAWVRSDVRKEVYRDGTLGNVSLLDSQATITIANAFGLHSWVRKVMRVSKHADHQVRVELQYRRPIAMVEVRDKDGQPGLLPVDIDGVVLPPNDFLSLPEPELRKYPRIVVGYSLPAGPIGTRWGDEKVHGGALLATELDAVWQPLGLYRIASGSAAGSEPEYELFTNGKRRVIWGRQPGREAAGESRSADKLIRLRELAAKGALDDLPGEAEIDLRSANVAELVPATDRK